MATKQHQNRRVRYLKTAHYEHVLNGGRIIWKAATLTRNGDRFLMSSPVTGSHTLAIICTDCERLAAHWDGFVFCNQKG